MTMTARRAGWLVAGLLTLAACDRTDPRLKGLAAGIGKDSAKAVMQGAPVAEEPYLVNSQYIEGVFYARQGATDSASKAPRRMTPLVFVNGKLLGWGWGIWDSVAGANKIVVPPKE